MALGVGGTIVVAVTATLAAIGAAAIPSAGLVTMLMVLQVRVGCMPLFYLLHRPSPLAFVPPDVFPKLTFVLALRTAFLNRLAMWP